ncbi:MAG: isopentenyl-diphosphate Delta-isomerase [Actinomycetota bacterium]|nr:isopentenyl-diphosphate Delta-isomerase [Actinomycetota bacterium]
MTTDPADLVVLLDDHARPCGTADRVSVHSTVTPLHLAFSCYLVDDRGQILMTRRALGKRTWPGVWTNSCCGHPRPGESMADAVARRVADELGTTAGPIVPVLPDFRYQATDASGIRENEVCPVFVASLADALDPDPSEVMEHRWAAPADLAAVAARSPWLLSPWSVEQINHMDIASLGADLIPG